MKRLILLTLILSPMALHALRSSHPSRPGHHIGPRHPRPVLEATAIEPGQQRVIHSYPMATPERAREDADTALRKAVSDWLAKEERVPRRWKLPEPILTPAIQADPVEESTRDYGTVYVQTLRWNASPELRGRLVESYEREVAGRRLVTLGGVLGFVLVCLGAMAGYIRADEATKGYYTNRLRLAAAAGVGAAGVALYRFLA
jgi:hypothetical protein